MNTLTWIAQIILAIMFTMTGYFKLFIPKEKLEAKMGWVYNYSSTTVKFIGACELLGAIGLILPMALNILPVLTPIAATGLSIIMIIATRTHLLRNEYNIMVITVLLFLLAVFVGIERYKQLIMNN